MLAPGAVEVRCGAAALARRLQHQVHAPHRGGEEWSATGQLTMPVVMMSGHGTIETAVEARGGFLGRPVLLVLVVSCILAVAALAFTYSGT